MTASWGAGVKSRTGMAAVSQVWAEAPEWYLWIEEAPGPFDLALQETETLAVAGRTLAVGRFTVKCYPYVSDPVFDTFSEEERRCLESELFDATRTPAFESRAKVPEPAFLVGALTIAVDEKDPLCMFTYDSLDVIRTIAPAARGAVRTLRRVPGWQTGYAVFDRLAGCYAWYGRRPPVRFGGVRSPGFETVIGEGGEAAYRETDASVQYSASLLFRGEGVSSRHVDALWDTRLEAADEVLFDAEWETRPAAPPMPAAFPVSPLWWELAVLPARSHLATTCGCEDGNHSGQRCIGSHRH